MIDEREQRIIAMIDPKPQDKILVIGTGVYPTIEETLFHKYRVKDITSTDISTKNLENALTVLPEVKFIYLNAQEFFPFEDKDFDKIIFTEVLEHLKDEYLPLMEIRRILKAKGSLIISVPKFRWYKIFNPITLFQHEREYSEKQIMDLLVFFGFKIEKRFVGGNIYELFNLWRHLILKHCFNVLDFQGIFQEKINKSYRLGYKGKGQDIIMRVKHEDN